MVILSATSLIQGGSNVSGADPSEQVWLHCSDESITRADRKKARLDDYSSKDAYILVYKRQEDVFPIDPSRAIVARVMERNAAFDKDFASREVKRRVLFDEYNQAQEAKKHVLDVLSGVSG